MQACEDRASEELYYLVRRVAWRPVHRLIEEMRGFEDSDDCIQEIYVIVLLALRNGALRNPLYLPGYVAKVTKCQIAKTVETQVRERTVNTPIESFCWTDERPDPEYRFRQIEYERIATESLAQLPPLDQTILSRFYLDDQTQAQICSEMELTPTQFRLRKSRAKAKFGEIGRRKMAGKSRRTALAAKIAA